MPIALERQNLHGAATARGGSSISGDLGCGFLAGGGNPLSRFCTEDQLDRYVAWMRDERGFTPVDGGAMEPDDQEIPAVVRGGRPPARGSDGGRHRQLCRHPGKGPLGARLDSQHRLGLARVPALRRQGGVVLEPTGRVDFSASALSAGIAAICPGLVRRPANAGRRRHGQADGISAIAPSFCCSRSMACGAVKLPLCGSTRSIGRGEPSGSFG